MLAPERDLRTGLHDFAGTWLRLRRQYGSRLGDFVGADPESFLEAISKTGQLQDSLAALRDTLWASPSLLPMLEAMRPSTPLLSVLMNLGVRVRIWPDVQALREYAAPPELGHVLACPLRVAVNDAEVMDCNLLVAEPRGPLRLCAGVVGLDVSLRDDPGRQLRVRLLAARRGG